MCGYDNDCFVIDALPKVADPNSVLPKTSKKPKRDETYQDRPIVLAGGKVLKATEANKNLATPGNHTTYEIM